MFTEILQNNAEWHFPNKENITIIVLMFNYMNLTKEYERQPIFRAVCLQLPHWTAPTALDVKTAANAPLYLLSHGKF